MVKKLLIPKLKMGKQPNKIVKNKNILFNCIDFIFTII
jgi:hypothetical protein